MSSTKIYELKHDVESKVIIDIEELSGIDFYGNFHLYLYKFGKIKVLVYDYLKRIDEPINLSELHNLFIGFTDPDYFATSTHTDLLESNEHYAATFEKYVHRVGEYLWFEGPMRYNSYIFDAKYLLLGGYQYYAAKGLKFAKAAFTHHAGAESFTRSISNKPAAFEMRKLFEDKSEIERAYFNTVLTTFNAQKPDFLHAYGYANIIEIYDTTSELMLKVTLNRDNFNEYEIVFPTKKKSKGRKASIDLAFNFIVKHKNVSSLLNYLMLDTIRAKTNDYLNKLTELKSRKSYEIYINSMSAVLNDMISRNPSTYVKYPRLTGIFVRDGIVEQNAVNMSAARSFLRIGRNINYKFVRDQVQLKSFYVKGEVHEIANQLFYLDCINIVDKKTPHDMTEYELIADNKLAKSKMMFREPVKNILDELFAEYEAVQASLESELEHAVLNNEIIDDTRKTLDDSKILSLPEIRFMNKYEDKYVDTPKYTANKELFEQNRKLARQIKADYEKSKEQ